MVASLDGLLPFLVYLPFGKINVVVVVVSVRQKRREKVSNARACGSQRRSSSRPVLYLKTFIRLVIQILKQYCLTQPENCT